MDKALLFVIKSYLKTITAYQDKDIDIIEIKPNIHGLCITYRLNYSYQRYSRIINYNKLIEILN